MDDDPEPTHDQMIVESHEGNEQLLSFGEQKCAAEIGEETPLESGDIGPAVDPESPKKPVAVKDFPTQTESKASIFRRKERMDQSQQADLPDSVKSSSTSLRKPSRRSSQRLIGQESRRSSQQPASQKSSRVQATNEADTKDPTWVSQRTGKVMKCRSQQTNLVWELKALSEILHPLSDESTPSRDEDSEFTTAEEDVTSPGETANGRYPGQRSRLGSRQLEGRVSKHSSQQYLERFGSRRSSQRSSDPPSTLGPVYSQVHPSKETDPDQDVTWISQRTGREMKCKAQQTSRVWGSRALSGYLSSSRQGSQAGREEESGLSAADELTSSGETGTEEPTAQREGSVSKHTSWQQFGRLEAHRNSQQTMDKPYLPNLKSSREEFTKERATEEQPLWTSQSAGKEMKCKSQQTSLIWEHKTLSDVLRIYGKASEVSRPGEEDTTEDEDGDTKMDQAAMKDTQRSNQSLEEEDSRQDIQQVEEQKAEPRRKKRKSKIDRSQQTDSAESIKKELADSSQQTDASESVHVGLVDLRQDSGRGSVEGSQRSSQELVGQDSGFSSPQPEHQDSKRSSQQSLSSEEKTSPEDETGEEEAESRVPPDTESEPPKLDQKASSIRGAEETTWVSQKTGRTVRNQSQQTDRSWLQYFALKSQKLKRCISQQTDESFLRRYKMGRQALREHRTSHAEPDMRRCTLCGDLYGDDFPFELDTLSSFSTMSILSTVSSQDTTEAESGDEQEPSTSGGDDERPLTPLPLPQESRRGSQPVVGQESPKGTERESQQGSLQAVDDPTFARWPNESKSSMASESSSLYTEAEDKIQQTYSMISFEDGIWLNRKTGKLLVTHSQQTSETSVAKVSERAPEKSGSTEEEEEEEDPAPAEVDDSSTGVNLVLQQEMEVDEQQPFSRGSRRGSQQDGNGESHLLPVEPTGEELQSADEVEKLVCSRLSEATLLSIESPDVEDGPVQIYAVVSLEKGTWRNIQTGKLLASQGQQTEASSPQKSTWDEEAAMAPSQETFEEGQVSIP